LEQVNQGYGKLESFKTYPCDFEKRKNLSIIYNVLNGLFDKMDVKFGDLATMMY